uniref:hypothetical protein n=1 Tax=Pseudomonas fluorescens TaxID=294 RepID=UPI001F406C59|nr:hypothetical protein [Pseudomonas fluorescens]
MASYGVTKLALEYWFETTPLRDRIWVQCSDASTVGRFSERGIDLHNTITEQLAGSPECRLCTHGSTTVADWALFREKVLEWWGLAIPADAISPEYLKPETSPAL